MASDVRSDHARYMTKGGLQSATKPLAIEYATRGIGVNAVGRMGEVTDIVDAIVFLEHARFITGEILHVGGGKSAGH